MDLRWRKDFSTDKGGKHDKSICLFLSFSTKSVLFHRKKNKRYIYC